MYPTDTGLRITSNQRFTTLPFTSGRITSVLRLCISIYLCFTLSVALTGCTGTSTEETTDPTQQVSEVPNDNTTLPKENESNSKTTSTNSPATNDPTTTDPTDTSIKDPEIKPLPPVDLPPLPKEWSVAKTIDTKAPVTDIASSNTASSKSGSLIAVAGQENIIQLISTADWSVTEQTGKQAGTIIALAFSSDEKSLAYVVNDLAEGTSSVYLLDIANEKHQLLSEKLAGQYTALAFHPNQPLIAVGDSNRTIQLVNLDEKSKPVALTGHKGFITSLAFSSDGKILVSGSGDQKAAIWDVEKRVPMGILTGHAKWITDVAISPSGEWIATTSDDSSSRIWDVSTKQKLHHLIASNQISTSVAFSPNNKLVATSCGDQKVRVYDTSNGKMITLLGKHTDYVNVVGFSSNGKYLFSGGQDHQLLVWEIPKEWQ